MKVLFLKVVHLLIIFVFIAKEGSAAAITREITLDKVIEDSLSKYVSEVNERIFPYLTKNQRKILKEISIEIDSASDAVYVNSNSYVRKISFSKGYVHDLNRYFTFAIIALLDSVFERSNFDATYFPVYYNLARNVPPEEAAELDIAQSMVIRKIAQYPATVRLLKEWYIFIYLHELSHQFQNINAQLKAINDKFPLKTQDSLLTNYEIGADSFALNLFVKLYSVDDIDWCEKVLTFNYYARENLFNQIRNNILYRMVTFQVFGYCLTNDCYSNPDTTSKSWKNFESKYRARLHLWLLYDKFLNSLDSPVIFMQNSIYKAFKDTLPNSLYVMGQFLFTGSTYSRQNIDTAYKCFATLCEVFRKNPSQFYDNNADISINNVEEACYYAGKISELEYHDNIAALRYYLQASQIKEVLSESYYNDLLQRISKQIKAKK